MASKGSRDFGELYRAAFAESDPGRKLELLVQVNRAILAWERTLASSNIVELRKRDEETGSESWRRNVGPMTA